MNTENMSQEQIENAKIELHKQLAQSSKEQGEITGLLNGLKQQKIALRRRMTDLEAEMQPYKTALDKAKYLNMEKRQQIKELEGKFWQRKDGM